jgi:site-specific DNA-methyltransferase (adenine-specific)
MEDKAVFQVKKKMKSMQYMVYFGDFRQIIPTLDDKPKLIIADPPFGIGFKSNMQTYNRDEDSIGYVEVSPKEYSSFIHSLLSLSKKALTDDGSMYIFSSWNNLKTVLNEIEEAGFHILNHIIWKYQFGVYTKKKFVSSHYHILLLVKNPKNYTFNKQKDYDEDVWTFKRKYNFRTKTAGNELPTELVKKCILTSSNKGDLVLDPVLGSGTTIKACIETSRQCIGIELNKDLIKRIKEKCGETVTYFNA